MTVPYTSVNGHMFSFLTPTGSLALRLGRGRRGQAFLERHRTTLHEAHGTVMKEYVSVPDDLFADTAAMTPLPRRQPRLRLGPQAEADPSMNESAFSETSKAIGG